jgi:predicted nucleotidyltransferase
MVETATKRRIEPEIAALLADLKRRLERRFGDRFVALYLFGSRARGDHDPDSDVDVAVVLDQEMPAPYDAKCLLIDDTYDLMLETGFYIQPWALEKGALETPEAHPTPKISRAVLRDGLRV